MSKYNVKGDVLAIGTNSWVRVDLSDEAGSNPTKIGFVQSWSVRKNLQTSEARVIGEIVPVSIDVTGISVDVQLSGFMPSKSFLEEGVRTRGDGDGELTLKSLNPDSDTLLTNKTCSKIAYLDIYDEKHGAILAKVEWLTPVSFSDSGNGADYVKCDVSFKAIISENGSDYASEI